MLLYVILSLCLLSQQIIISQADIVKNSYEEAMDGNEESDLQIQKNSLEKRVRGLLEELDRVNHLRFGNESVNVYKDVSKAISSFNSLSEKTNELKKEVDALDQDEFKEISLDVDEITGKIFNSLGEMWLYMESVDIKNHDFEKAHEYFLKAEATGNAHAQHNLALMYSLGIGVHQDTAKALTYEYFSALGGSLRASMALGYRHWKGINVPKSCDTAVKYYEVVAEEGNNYLSYHYEY
jgi:TPR repeat protein